MLMKSRSKPLRILQIEALLRRLPDYHRKRAEIEVDYRNGLLGFNGEKQLDYYLSFLPGKDFRIYNDLRLILHTPFQIDSLLITPFFAVIIEVKNYSGTLYFEPISDQVIQKHGQKEKVIPNPVSQVLRQVSQFKEWLLKEKVPELPIEYFVTITNPAAYIKTEKENSFILKRVVHTEKIIDRLMNAKSKYNKQILWPNDINRLNEKILCKNSPLDNDILNTYGINRKDLLRGVQCHSCKSFAVVRKDGKWCCLKCKMISRTSHMEAITDYLLLFNSKITNKECRDYLNLESRHTAYRVLKSLNLSGDGPAKKRIYSKVNV
ncbi:nuclease-related domain-containing protein [Cytobacillus sp. NJ13]|nr:nuclease-related domain-containing protein [Cytobacillus sp. NJ13]